ncbi:MAG: hypothetical protein J5J00_06715 [Deltaproteobacteria bacterium]|nr:hypothetical protein [Deltaproteobacteria bacterium]
MPSPFLLIRPKIFAIKNSLERRRFLSSHNARDSVLLALAIFVMVVIYRGTIWALVQINAQPELLYLSPQYPLGMILSLLLFMLLLSSVATAVGSLFMAEDLDLVLSSPLPIRGIFFSKLAYVLVSTSWMPLIFLTPFLIAFGQAYNAGLGYYLGSPLILFPYFVIPAAFAVVIATVLTRLLPPYRSREVLFAAVLVFLTIIFFLADLLRLGLASSNSSESLMRLVGLLSVADVSWLPSNWVAINLDSLITQGSFSSTSHVLLLYFTALASSSLAHVTIQLFHFDAYSKARNTRRNRSARDSSIRRFFAKVMPASTARPLAALMNKEMLSFSRDVTQMVQLILLLGLCLIYIFNLRVFMALDSLPSASQDWWRNFFFATNCCMAAFVTTGFCTRFVFVSLSLEGRSFWLLQSAPLNAGQILAAKFSCWYVPVALLTSCVFAAAAIATGVGLTLIVVSIVASWIICYGIVGLAVGLGARFANFTWEHTSQLAVGFGNMVFMLTSIALICFNITLASLMLFGRPMAIIPASESANRILYFTIVSLSIVCINHFTKKFSLKWGEASLLKRLESAL